MRHDRPVVLLVLFALAVLTACASPPTAAAPVAGGTTLADCGALAQYQGEVLVLLMGKPGCPGTKKAMAFLPEYNRRRPAGVAVLRLDVPVPGGKSEKAADVPADFPYGIDAGRAVAETLGFYYYPTLYIFDRDGALRYSGGAEEERVVAVVDALLAEELGAEKTRFDAGAPETGDAAPGFAGAGLDGRRVSFQDLRGDAATLLVFSSVTCPFSKKAMASIPRLAAEFEAKGVGFVIVDPAATAAEIEPFYSATAPGTPVLVDGDRAISRETYGVETVPYFFAIDGKGRVAHAMPFTEESARQAIASVLGLSAKPVEAPASGAG